MPFTQSQLSLMPVLPAIAERPDGADGVPTGVTSASLALPLPTALAARTRNLYCVPLTRLLTVWVVVVGLVPICVHVSVDGAADAGPSTEPTRLLDELSARTRKVYVVPDVRFGAVYCVVFALLWGMSVHDDPLFVLYCHLAMPVVLAGFVQTRRTPGPSRPMAERPLADLLSAGSVRAYSHFVMEESLAASQLRLALR